MTNSKQLLIILSTLFPFIAQSSCGNIPGTYPLFNTNEIKLEEEFEVNGIEGDYEESLKTNKAISINGSVNTVNLNLPDLDPSTFPNNNSSTEQTITRSTTLNNRSEVFYNKLLITSSGISITFKGGGDVHINELLIDNSNITLNFETGTYYIDKLIIKGSNTIFNTSGTPVIFHIGTELTISDNDITFNSAGSVDSFRTYLHSNSKIDSSGANLNYKGVIYGPNNVSAVKFTGDNNSIHGAIITAGGIIEIIGKESSLTYTSDDQTAINNISTCTDGGGTVEEDASDFNCIETTTTNENSAIKQIHTKLVNSNFNLDVVALKNNELIKTKYNKTVKVEIINQLNGNALYTNENFEFVLDDNARKRFSLQLNTAYSDLICRVTYTTGSTDTIGESDNFSVRPLSLSVSSNLTNTSSTGLPKAKSGEYFTLSATSSTGYTGIPKIDNLKLQAHSGAIQNGSVSGTFNAAVSTVAIGNNFSYSEVGSLQFTAQGIYDDSFTLVDQPNDCTDDFSNTPDANGKVGCKFGTTISSDYFGRFTPDHLDVSLNTPAFVPSCGTFTYLGQPVKYITLPIATVTAKNASGNTTQNYTGDYWKINPTDGTYGFTPAYSIASHSLTILEDSAPSVTDNNNGTGSLTFADSSSNILAITKNTITAPFDAEIALSFTLSDTDGIVTANVNGSAQVNPVSFGTTSTGNGINFSNKAHRWGRAILNNIHGSELTPLSIPVITEYFDGTNFIINTADNCSTFSLASNFSISDTADFNCTLATQTSPVSIGSSGTVKASLSNTTLSSGTTQLIISDNSNTASGPGSGNTGYVEVTTNLSNLSWLNYDWDADNTHDNCPSARATFGIYDGNSKQIYFREVY